MERNTASIEAVRKIIQDDLAECDREQRAAFQQYAVEPYLAPILRYGELGRVVVIARRKNDVIYWEDIEEGFNLSPVDPDGRILEHWCNLDNLGLALNAWIEGRAQRGKLGPVVRVE